MAKPDRTKRLAKKRARREKRLQKRVAFYRRTAAPAVMMDLPKMSEALPVLAAPLLDTLQRPCAAQVRPILLLAAKIWNLTRYLDEDLARGGKRPEDLRREAVEVLAADTGLSHDDCEFMIEGLVERKHDLFGDDPRFVSHVEVIDTENGLRFFASSTL
jgi:hypothetical protein